MALKNPWVNYITRSYQDIKTSILTKLSVATPEITDHSDSNILIIVIDIFAGIAEMINYYIDNMSREAFVTTARRYSSMIKHARLIDYRVKAAIPSTVDIIVTFLNTDDTPYIILIGFNIPKGSSFTTENSVEFVTVENIDVNIGDTSIILPVRQMTPLLGKVLGVTTPDLDQTLEIGINYAHDTIDLKVGLDIWFLKSTLGRSGPTDKHYIVEISSDKIAFVKFGDGLNGAIPTAAQNVTVDYFTTLGSLGNVNINTIINTTFDFNAENIPTFNITNNLSAVAGTDYEDIERIRRSAPLSLRTLDRAVTTQDYIDIAKLAPGVDKANLSFDCGKEIEIYITPNNGGIASTDLLNSTKNYINLRKMVTTFINVLPSGISNISLKINATARFRASGIITIDDIKKALVDKYSLINSDVNQQVRKSDIIALVDNLEKVDFLELEYVYLIPYMRPNISSTSEMVKTMTINSGSTVLVNWLIQYDGTFMRLFKEGQNVATITIGILFNESSNIFSITINENSYSVGMQWNFITYPYNKDIELDDFTIPIVSESDLNINVKETLNL